MIGHINELHSISIKHSEAKDASMKVLVSPQEGWDSHVMRMIEVEKAGYTPKHSHPWPHINYIIEGEGVLMINGTNQNLSPGSYAYVPANALHQFQNAGNQILRFICIVPKEGHQY
jgi:quercetin dioxygenase-like cupin family protein